MYELAGHRYRVGILARALVAAVALLVPVTVSWSADEALSLLGVEGCPEPTRSPPRAPEGTGTPRNAFVAELVLDVEHDHADLPPAAERARLEAHLEATKARLRPDLEAATRAAMEKRSTKGDIGPVNYSWSAEGASRTRWQELSRPNLITGRRGHYRARTRAVLRVTVGGITSEYHHYSVRNTLLTLEKRDQPFPAGAGQWTLALLVKTEIPGRSGGGHAPSGVQLDEDEDGDEDL